MHLGPEHTVEDGKVRLPGQSGKYVDLGNVELPSTLTHGDGPAGHPSY